MSHTCGRKELRDITEYLKTGLADAPKYSTGAAREAWLTAHIERVIKLTEHMAECMEPGPDDPEPEQD